ncbi:hypothetical protein U1Q18_010603, partial [Sarracenia purpurea var. burkii]
GKEGKEEIGDHRRHNTDPHFGFRVHATSNQLCPAGSVDDPRKWESNPFKWVKLLLQWMRKKEGNRTATVVSVAHHQLPFRFKEFDFLLRGRKSDYQI